MYILITYDVVTEDKAGQRRLRRVARACENIGQRVQNSVFECEVSPAQLVDIRSKLLKIIDQDSDSLRIYHMGSNWHHKIEQLGKEKSYDISGPFDMAFAPTPSLHQIAGRSAILVRHWKTQIDNQV